MIVDGKKIEGEIKEALKDEIKKRKRHFCLSIFESDHTLAGQKFVNIKKRFAKDIGVSFNEYEFPESADTRVLKKMIKEVIPKSNGIIIQLPLPSHIERDKVLNSIPLYLDVDVLSKKSIKEFENGTLPILPPVVGAIKEILDRSSVDVRGKKVVIIGKGMLVGAPSAVWFKREGGNVEVVDSKTHNLEEKTHDADIIVSGVGKPHMLAPDMLRQGVVLLDAGTSEMHGKLAGDAHPSCAGKCSVFTPVPGGIGPITIAVLFKNLIELNK
jgi:methylenetetrahydrofolate dehydrogenase (NADP+)/methenyltetrahydrofolate cyclohydrolase|tara:strand:+ start:10635 stop:11444 length:810 start_codon:yes stop_codon:yes gene_type:complete